MKSLNLHNCYPGNLQMFPLVLGHKINNWNKSNTSAGFKLELFKEKTMTGLYVHSVWFIFQARAVWKIEHK